MPSAVAKPGGGPTVLDDCPKRSRTRRRRRLGSIFFIPTLSLLALRSLSRSRLGSLLLRGKGYRLRVHLRRFACHRSFNCGLQHTYIHARTDSTARDLQHAFLQLTPSHVASASSSSSPLLFPFTSTLCSYALSLFFHYS